MDQSRSTLWFEDLESHRQPSLYYLSTEDDKSGPHLICDWNGAPTNIEEFDIDIMSKFIQQRDKTDDANKDSICPSLDYDVEEDQIKFSQIVLPKRNSSRTILSEDDGSRFDFLTVPPMASSLIKRLLKTQSARRPKPIPEEPESIPINRNAIKQKPTESTKKRSQKGVRPMKEVQSQA